MLFGMASSNAPVTIRPMLPKDWDAVRDIYQEGIRTGNATFETEVPDWEKWNRSHLPDCRLLACTITEVAGWAALSPISAREVYRGVAEVSIYVAERVRGNGIGSQLLAALITASEEHGIWTLQAGIFPENVASVALHERHGFRIVGTRERIGCLKGCWRDVALMERRSTSASF
jgi:phosphinothricin acetyltransferase